MYIYCIYILYIYIYIYLYIYLEISKLVKNTYNCASNIKYAHHFIFNYFVETYGTIIIRIVKMKVLYI